MTRFNRALVWMTAFLILVAILGTLVGTRLVEIFQANPFFNGGRVVGAVNAHDPRQRAIAA